MTAARRRGARSTPRGINMNTLSLWIRQPTTVAGIAALCGTVSAVLLKQMSLAEAVPLLAGSLVSMVLPDNTAAKQHAEVVAQDIVTGIAQKQGAGK
jgi:phage tail protein X